MIEKMPDIQQQEMQAVAVCHLARFPSAARDAANRN
jgi:hypothetical protein